MILLLFKMLSFDSGEGGENVERAQFYFSELLLQDTSRKLDADIIKWLLDKILPLKDGRILFRESFLYCFGMNNRICDLL